jgi:hypothetical protein
MLIPHVLLASRLHWAPQAFTLHAVIVVITVGLGMRAENVQHAAAAAPAPRARHRPRKKHPTNRPKEADTLVWLDRSLRDSDS